MKKSFSSIHKPSPQEIQAFFAQFGCQAPPDYERFLMEHNGGVPRRRVFDTPGDDSKTSVISCFCGLGVDTDHDLQAEFDNYRKRLVRGIVPIGYDVFGNLLCLGLNKKNYGRIFFWRHELETEPPKWSTLIEVGPSFAPFFASLRRLQEDEDEDNDTLKHLCKQGTFAELSDALKSGLNPNSKVRSGHSLARVCASAGDLEKVKLLVQAGASLESVLYDALFSKREDIVLWLLESGIESHQKKFADNSTLLHAAAEHGCPKVAKWLIEHGCPVNHQDNQKQSALVYARDASVRKIIQEAGGRELYR